MKKFMDEDFLLQTRFSKRLYHDYAKDMPIYDYHCHLNPAEIAENKKYGSITELWLGGDHYKWRAMRSNGVDEDYITGKADDYEKFEKWSDTLSYAVGNPLFHWSQLELKRYFGINDVLTSANAREIFDECNKKLATDKFRTKNLISKSNVSVICTTDDPCDDLKNHMLIADDQSFTPKVLPTFRPDKAFNAESPEFPDYIKKLGKSSSIEIKNADDIVSALISRISFFHETGCRISDHGFVNFEFSRISGSEANEIFSKVMDGEKISKVDIIGLRSYIIEAIASEYAKLGWAMQIHVGATRQNNSRMSKLIGPDTGFDSISDGHNGEGIVSFLDALNEKGCLPRTIVYCLNPRDNELLGTIIGSFQEGGIAGKMQFGSGWWFNDNKDGMERQMTALANLGLLGRFIGMLTDSRSFISYTRHEYFRRILCNMIGNWVEEGQIPANIKHLGKIVKDISYNNAANYFNIEV